MAIDPSELENLHQQASNFYLQGEFQKATEVWQKILSLDPSDLRAGEGVRLCELLIGEGPSFVNESAAVTPTATPAAEAEATPPPVPSADSDAMDFDFSDHEEAPAASTPPPVPQPAPLDEPSAEAAAAAELKTRVGELFAEATVAYQQGAREEAITLLRRLEILDENHSGATELAAKIASDDEVETPTPAETEDESHDLLGELDFDTVDEALNMDAAPAVAAGEVAAEPSADLGDLDDLGDLIPEVPTTPTVEDDGPVTESVTPPTTAATSTTTERTARRRERQSRQVPRLAMIVAAVLVLVIAGGWFAYTEFFGTSDEPPQTAEIQEPQTPVVDDSADDANVAASPVKIVDVDALRVSADEAIALGDYAGAIVLLNKIQKTRPDDRKLKQEVLQLGDLFREQQEVLDSWQSAVDAFNTGDYRSALTVFYRLPETERGERLSRYMINGWFNLGMQALTSGNCDGATAHFTEASDINSDDPGVSHGLRLADECSGAVRDRAWMDRIESIGFRDLEYGG